MHFPHNVSLVRICVYVPHNDQLGRTDFPHNALSPQCITCTYVCVRSPQRPTTMHRFSPQCTFPTMYHLYVCVYFPHNDQLGRTDFPHNAMSPQCIICTYVCVSVTLSVNSPTGQTPQRIFTVDSLKDADLRKDVTCLFGGLDLLLICVS